MKYVNFTVKTARNIVVISLLSGCTHYYHTIPNQEIYSARTGKLELSISRVYVGDFTWRDYPEYVVDTSVDYYSLTVAYDDTLSYSRSIRLEIDSIEIIPEKPFPSFRFAPPESETGKINVWRHKSIEPFPLPRDYKRDFDVVFTLRVTSDQTGELIESISLSIRCKWTRHFYTIFNSPYD